MSDARLRELERAWRLSGAAEDEAAWLAARGRAGALAPSRLEAAALCGHEAALRALDPGWRTALGSRELAGLLGVHRNTPRRWPARGCPVHEREGELCFVLLEVAPWLATDPQWAHDPLRITLLFLFRIDPEAAIEGAIAAWDLLVGPDPGRAAALRALAGGTAQRFALEALHAAGRRITPPASPSPWEDLHRLLRLEVRRALG